MLLDKTSIVTTHFNRGQSLQMSDSLARMFYYSKDIYQTQQRDVPIIHRSNGDGVLYWSSGVLFLWQFQSTAIIQQLMTSFPLCHLKVVRVTLKCGRFGKRQPVTNCLQFSFPLILT